MLCQSLILTFSVPNWQKVLFCVPDLYGTACTLSNGGETLFIHCCFIQVLSLRVLISASMSFFCMRYHINKLILLFIIVITD